MVQRYETLSRRTIRLSPNSYATHYSLIIRELNALVIDVAIKTEKHFLFAMTYNQCKLGKNH